ncbi:MAG: hypothetical protein NVS4B8_27170 [Herpetosiphon sp.]
MSLTDQLLAGLVSYGLPMIFGAVLIASAGIPLPVTVLLVAAGSFVAQGDLNLRWVIGLAISAAVLGDQIGYFLGRWGGGALLARTSRLVGGAEQMQKAERVARRWGGPGIFLSRWLFTALGPAFNVSSGITQYPWPRFFIWDVAGEAVWVVLYVLAGELFSSRVQALSTLLGDLTWVMVGLFLTFVFGKLLWNQTRSARRAPIEQPERVH